MIRQEDILLAKGANSRKASDGFREPSEDWGFGDRIQPFEFTRSLEVIPAALMSASAENREFSYIRRDTTVEPSQRWYDDKEDGENDANDHNDPNASR